ncbi:terminase large subunit domain-containing protein [Methyloversatilis discipulorum]|uniref:terminase large subunit domain-containing protein n=1 Tax=Methyloversatilis discipulorum TaxID=1119528 RepID=UPI003137BA8D
MELALHPQQSEAYLSTATEILYGGAAGGGKSHLMRVGAIAWCTDIPGLQVYIFRRLSDDLLKNHMEGVTGFPALLSEWIDSGLVKINWSKAFIEFWNGSKIHLCHCQYEKDVTKYQGAEIHVLMLDELTHFTEKIYRYLRGRCRMGALKLPKKYAGLFPRILGSANPGGIGHNWVKATFIDIAPPRQITRQPKSEGGMLRQYIPAKLADNPTLLENDPDYADRLEGLGNAALVKAMRDGDWNIVAGGMFDDVWDEKRHALHPFDVPAGWRIDRSFDWGSTKPFSVGWWAEADGTDVIMRDGTRRSFPRGTLIRIAEWYGWNGKPNEGLRMLAVEVARGVLKVEREIGIAGRVKSGPADSAIFDTQNGVCIADDMAKAGVKWEKADKGPGSRRNGWERMRKMLKAALRHPMEEPGILVFDTCRQFIRTVPVLPRDERQPDDIDTDAEDHVGDETRYRCTMPTRTATVAPLRM